MENATYIRIFPRSNDASLVWMLDEANGVCWHMCQAGYAALQESCRASGESIYDETTEEWIA